MDVRGPAEELADLFGVPRDNPVLNSQDLEEYIVNFYSRAYRDGYDQGYDAGAEVGWRNGYRNRLGN
jgi:hypothetical protein|tara:strand:+ start:9847 stop:10047 length:201 start_codon:yes stop_codon:yes gene_type:complete